MQTYITGLHNAWLQCLQCVSKGVVAALHWAIDIDLVHGQWPGAWLAPGRCLYRMMTLYMYIPHEINYMCGIEMTIYATYMYMGVILQGYWTGWFDAGLQCLQCVSIGVAAALHWAIDIVHGQWPGAWLAPDCCLYLYSSLKFSRRHSWYFITISVFQSSIFHEWCSVKSEWKQMHIILTDVCIGVSNWNLPCSTADCRSWAGTKLMLSVSDWFLPDSGKLCCIVRVHLY